MGPTDASLRRVGLQWYAEFDDVPTHCKMRAWVDKDKGTFRFDVLDRECVEAITGKSATETFTEEDVETIKRYLRKTGNKLTDSNWLRFALEQSDAIGNPISNLLNASRVYDQKKARESISETLHGTADAIGNTSDFLAKIFDPANLVAIALLVIGGGLIGLGGMKLLT